MYAVPYYSVEALYFHPQVLRWIATRVVSIHGGDAHQLEREATASGVAVIGAHTERLSRKVAKKMIRRSVMNQIPSDDRLLDGGGDPLVIVNEAEQIHARCRQRLEAAVQEADWETILVTCPVRESSALEEVSRGLRFGKRQDYERSVRHLLSQDEEARNWMRALFGDLAAHLRI